MIQQREDRVEQLKYRDIIDQVAKATKCADHGIAIHLAYNRDGQFEYIIAAGPSSYHTLLASVTSKERLLAHTNGFIQTHTVK